MKREGVSVAKSAGTFVRFDGAGKRSAPDSKQRGQMTFYIWQDPRESEARRVTEVSVRGGKIEIQGDRDPTLEALIHDIAARPSLPFLTEYKDASKRRFVERVNVHAGELNYEFALTQAIQREGGYLLSFTQNAQRAED